MRVLTVLMILLYQGCWSFYDCTIGDYSQAVGMDDATLELFEVGWIKNAAACKVGPYLVYAPASGESQHQLWVIRTDLESMEPVAGIGSDTVTIFQPSTGFLAQFGNRDELGNYGSMSYEGYDGGSRAAVTVYDFDLDGSADARSFYFRGIGSHQHQHRLGDEWHDLVKQDGRYGYIIDGQFHTIPEAKALLIERSSALQR